MGYRAFTTVDKVVWQLRTAWARHRGQERVALASYPRSGNTWFRFFLEAATGELTGTASDRPSRVLARGREGVVIKTHQLDSHKYTRGIHLVRNPFDVLDSFYEWKKSLGWQWKYGELSWDEFVPIFAFKWREHSQHWASSSCETYRVRYEDCRRDPVRHFSLLLAWMKKDVSDERLRSAVEATSFDALKKAQAAESPHGDQFFRRGQVNRGIERFSQEQQELMVGLLEVELVQYGYTDLIEIVKSGRRA